MQRCFTALVLVSVLGSTSAAQCPTWDMRFGPSGLGDAAFDFTVLDLGDGPALFAAGAFGSTSGSLAEGVARWDGTSWSPLGESIQLDLLHSVSRLRAVDLGAGPRLCALGRFDAAGGVPASGVALWDGAQWDTLAGGPPPGAQGVPPILSCAAVFDRGSGPELYVGGAATASNTSGYVPYLARWDGMTWTRVLDGPSHWPCPDWPCPDGSITGLEAFDDGSGEALYAAGHFERVGVANGRLLARFDGGSWTTLAGGLGGGAYELVVHDDGSGARLHLSSSITGPPYARVYRWNGQALEPLGAGPVGFAGRLRSLPASAGAPAGLYTLPGRPNNSTGILSLERWDGASWSSIDLQMGSSIDTYALESFDGGAGNELVVGGRFAVPIAGVATSNVARWDGAQWQALGAPGHGLASGSSTIPQVSAFAVHDDGSGPALYAGGRFDWSGTTPLGNVARWTGAGWDAIPGFNLPTLHDVADLLATDVAGGSRLWIAGDLKVGTSNPHAAASWDGATLVGYLTSHEGAALATFDPGSGEELYLSTTSRIHRWNGSGFAPTPWGLGGGEIHALLAYDDGSGEQLYVAGDFVEFANLPIRNVARWDGTTWEQVGDGLGDGFSTSVHALHAWDDGSGTKLFAGGAFDVTGATPASGLARWDGVAWEPVAGGVGGALGWDVGPERVLSLAVVDDGRGDGAVLYVGGEFDSVGGGVPAKNLARWNGTSWEGAGLAVEGVVPEVRALHGADLPELGGPFLAVGGRFGGAGDVAAQNVAVLGLCETTGELFCFGDGSAGTCPCGNASAPGDDAGCLNSHGTAAALRSFGNASLTDDTLTFFGAGMLPTSPVLYFQAGNTHAPLPFGDGLKCTGGPFVRLLTKINQGGASTYPEAGDLPISVRGMITQPGIRHYQARYRDPLDFCTPDNFNYTNAVTIVWSL